MPELPEVQSLVEFLGDHVVGHVIARVDVASIAVLKTFDPPVTALAGLTVIAAARRGKFLDLDVDGLHLVTHLSRAGWLQWRDELPATPPKPGKSPIALRVHLDTGGGFDLTEAGTQKRLAVYVVRDPALVPGIARLGPEPLDDDFTVDRFAALLDGQRVQIKGLLRDQGVIAGIGNAYSDEILHVAKMSPYKIAATLTAAEVHTLFEAMRTTLLDAVGRAHGLAAADLKAEKKIGMRVHGRAGEACPVCGDTVREVSFATSFLDYCPTCQTGGKPLADRRMSKLLK
ncbi:MAG TPA: DNA-formamidopyrimidine glycosylase family protein [Mycobacteriales bacterium]|nr:DNA-formamidopyrimidine glycosylase family protein [Mycobacteriales bacterium]